MEYTLNCLILGEINPFPVTINQTQLVGKLKDAIKEEQQLSYPTRLLTLYKINVGVSDDNKYKSILHGVSQPGYVFNPKFELNPVHEISWYFGQSSDRPKGAIHILVETPQSESIDPRVWVPSLRICSSPHEFTLPYCPYLRMLQPASELTINSSAALDTNPTVSTSEQGLLDQNSLHEKAKGVKVTRRLSTRITRLFKKEARSKEETPAVAEEAPMLDEVAPATP